MKACSYLLQAFFCGTLKAEHGTLNAAKVAAIKAQSLQLSTTGFVLYALSFTLIFPFALLWPVKPR